MDPSLLSPRGGARAGRGAGGGPAPTGAGGVREARGAPDGRRGQPKAARHGRPGHSARTAPHHPRAPAGLTAREAEIVKLIAQGLRNAEIATRMYVSVKTVDHHVSSVLAKLGVRSRAEVVREAARLGLLDDAA
ncbi:MAG: response regulator transcription factor [Armatimonadota bacterium]|nr:response regulator transcription factor [Armatimonadota bacterium]MDR7472599.1 response regulator transcription factor [Armatimonadota bacterium]MDR7561388.1 response regulator transcription factor [Armatimonadota bacterium]MDR7583515.1 response regulator transcription factor [Armatimonadota bacterium]MDR7589087.1 response regulator transcription factor [Armatimonadota bacterium]